MPSRFYKTFAVALVWAAAVSPGALAQNLNFMDETTKMREKSDDYAIQLLIADTKNIINEELFGEHQEAVKRNVGRTLEIVLTDCSLTRPAGAWPQIWWEKAKAFNGKDLKLYRCVFLMPEGGNKNHIVLNPADKRRPAGYFSLGQIQLRKALREEDPGE